jgi:hypothetical protein
MDLLPCFCCLAPLVLGLAVLAYLPLLKKEKKPTESRITQ